MFVCSVIERGLMATVTFFKTVLGDASVSLHSSSVKSLYISLIANPLYRASAREGTLSFVTAVTGWRCGLLLI